MIILKNNLNRIGIVFLIFMFVIKISLLYFPSERKLQINSFIKKENCGFELEKLKFKDFEVKILNDAKMESASKYLYEKDNLKFELIVGNTSHNDILAHVNQLLYENDRDVAYVRTEKLVMPIFAMYRKIVTSDDKVIYYFLKDSEGNEILEYKFWDIFDREKKIFFYIEPKSDFVSGDWQIFDKVEKCFE